MRAILIDPFACEVKEIDFDGSNIQNFYTVLSHEIHPVDCFEIAPNEVLDKTNDSLYVDEEGLLHNPKRGFILSPFPQVLAGKGVIVGTDEDGEATDAKVDLETVSSRTRFILMVPGGYILTDEPWQNSEIRA